MTSERDNLATISEDGLADILLHINREKYPVRYQAVRDEFVRRHGATIAGASVDTYFDLARRQRPFAERSAARKKVFLVLLAWSALMLAIKGVLYLVAELRAP